MALVVALSTQAGGTVTRTLTLNPDTECGRHVHQIRVKHTDLTLTLTLTLSPSNL